MILDNELQLAGNRTAGAAGAQAITAASVGKDPADASVIYLDRGSAANDLGEGADTLELIVQVVTTFSGASFTALDCSFVSSTQTDLTTAQLVHASKRIPVAQLVAGNLIRIGKINGPTQQYSGAYFNPIGASAAAGAVKAYLVDEAQSNPVSFY